MNTNMSRFLLVWMLAAAIFASSILVILQPSMPNQSAFATFPGNNGLIAFSKDGEIFTMNADGSDQHNISNDPGFDYAPSWSPDGTKIAFTRGGEIYVMNADGSDQHNISNNVATADMHPDWGTHQGVTPTPDTTPPVVTVPEDMMVEATGPDGAQVSFA